MKTEPTVLRELDCLDMDVCLCALRTRRRPRPVTYCMTFRLRMRNVSSESVRLVGRKWILRNRAGETHVIEGAKVFNQEPVLRPGDVFSYSGSQEFRESPPAAMEVRYFGTDQRNEPFITPPLVFPEGCFPRR